MRGKVAASVVVVALALAALFQAHYALADIVCEWEACQSTCDYVCATHKGCDHIEKHPGCMAEMFCGDGYRMWVFCPAP